MPSPSPSRDAAKSRRNRRNLLALGSAAVFAVYTAGYMRTLPAARQLDADERNRPPMPGRATSGAMADRGTGKSNSASQFTALPGPASGTATESAAKSPYKDGSFYGWGWCRHGELKVVVTIKEGKIVSADIAECYTRYSKNVISRLPGQVVARQSANVDWISGATQSSDAFYYAVVEALKAAQA